MINIRVSIVAIIWGRPPPSTGQISHAENFYSQVVYDSISQDIGNVDTLA